MPVQPDSSSCAITTLLSRETLIYTTLCAITHIHVKCTYARTFAGHSRFRRRWTKWVAHTQPRAAACRFRYRNFRLWQSVNVRDASKRHYNGSFTSTNCASMSDELMSLISVGLIDRPIRYCFDALKCRHSVITAAIVCDYLFPVPSKTFFL